MYAERVIRFPGLPLRPDPRPTELPNGKKRWTRSQVACDACHSRRVRCDMIYSAPCSRCQHKHMECVITRERRKRGRRGKSEQVNKKQPHRESGVHDTSRIQEEAEPDEEEPTNESRSTSFSIKPIISDSTSQPRSPATDNIENSYCPTSMNTTNSSSHSRISSSQILEELGMGLTEECLSNTRLFQDLLELNVQNDLTLPPLPDLLSSDDTNSQPVSQTPSPILSFQECDPFLQNCKLIQHQVGFDGTLAYSAGCGDTNSESLAMLSTDSFPVDTILGNEISC